MHVVCVNWEPQAVSAFTENGYPLWLECATGMPESSSCTEFSLRLAGVCPCAGGLIFFSLLMEEEGVEYQRDERGSPILPVFRLAGIPVPEPKAGQTLPPFSQSVPYCVRPDLRVPVDEASTISREELNERLVAKYSLFARRVPASCSPPCATSFPSLVC